MELLYVYIDKYRNFAKQEIHFSNKFKISYSKSDKKLSIVKNEDYIDIYPKNIAGITAIVGMNASGKTSLLDLIGTQIGELWRNREIIKFNPVNPHKKMDARQVNENQELAGVTYKADYFLVYGCKDANDDDLFVFESGKPQQYIDIFSNAQSMMEKHKACKPYQQDANIKTYNHLKFWFSCVFKKIDSNLDSRLYKGTHLLNDSCKISSKACMLFFKNSFRSFSKHYDKNTSIARYHAALESMCLYNQVKLIIKQMANESSATYDNGEYKLVIYLKTATSTQYVYQGTIFNDNKYVKDYRGFEISSFDDAQNRTLEFLYGYVYYVLDNFVCKAGIAHKDQALNPDQKDSGDAYTEELKENCKKELENNKDKPTTYKEIKNYFRKQIKIISEHFEDKYNTIEAYDEIEQAIENLFIMEDECHIAISHEKNKFTLKLNKDTDIEPIKSFFISCLGEYELEKDHKYPTSIRSYAHGEINFLSEGEKANLAMFTSIDEQLRINTKAKENYILLFDEIENSMHPEMCRKLLSSLMAFLGGYPEKSFQIIIASHSPFIISDIRKENIICLENKDKKNTVKQLEGNTFGQNIHSLLKNEFFLTNTYGEYSRTFIQKIASWLTEGKDLKDAINDFINSNLNIARIEKEISNLKTDIAKTQEHDSELGDEIVAIQKNIARLESDLVNMQKHDAMLKAEKINQKVVVSNLEEAKTYLRKVIDSIGEPILRNYLKEQFDEYSLNLVKDMSIDAQIQQHEEEIKKLRARKGGNSK